MDTNAFGPYVKRLREARRLTQDELAERCGLAADTIRRLEHADFSPSLRTLRKLVTGLGMSVSGLFTAYELADDDDLLQDVVALLSSRSRAELKCLLRFLRELIAALDEHKRQRSDTASTR